MQTGDEDSIDSVMTPLTGWLMPLDEECEFNAAELALSAAIAANPLAPSAIQVQMLGYLHNRADYLLRTNVHFFTARGHTCLARVERCARTLHVALCVSQSDDGNGGVNQDSLYKTIAAEILTHHTRHGTDKVLVGCVPKRLEACWVTFLERRRWSVAVEDCVWFLEKDLTSHSLGSIDDPQCELSSAPYMTKGGYFKESRLKSSDTELVDRHWPFGGDNGSSYIERMIEGHPSTCLRPATSEDENSCQPPVAWILAYPYGAIGSLHVLDAHRRKGLASRLISAQCNYMRSCSEREGRPSPLIHAYALLQNGASQSLFDKLENWHRVDENVSWIVCENLDVPATD